MDSLLNAPRTIFRTAAAAEAMLAKIVAGVEPTFDGERYVVEARGAVFVIALYDDVGLVGLI